MNTDTTAGPGEARLPELTQESIDRIETAVFERIEDERAAASARRAPKARSRRRAWLTAGGVAAAFVLGAVVTPPLVGGLGGISTTSASSVSDGGWALTTGESAPDSAAAGDAVAGSPIEATAGGVSAADRQIIVNASASLRVTDVRAAADALTTLAAEHGGHVEGLRVGGDGTVVYSPDGAILPVSGGWISMRVPAADLDAVMAALAEYGEVLSTTVDESDVTAAAIDLQARIDAAEASVLRLSELMAQAGSVSELLEAESTLTARQGELESYRQQLEDLQDQVAMSSLTVSLTQEQAPVAADPAGFGDGLSAGWAGLIAAANGLVVVLGFLLPWLAVAAVAALLVWGVVRVIRGRRARHDEGFDTTETP